MAGAAKGVKKLGGHWACKKSAAKPTPLGSDSASWRQDSSELGRVLIDRLMTNNFFHHDFLRCAFSCGLLLQAHSVRAGFYITWSFQEISVVFAWTGPKGTEVLIKSLHSMQEDANPHFEIFTSQSRFYWINLTSPTMAFTMGNQRQYQMPSFISYSHISRHQIIITNIGIWSCHWEKKHDGQALIVFILSCTPYMV